MGLVRLVRRAGAGSVASGTVKDGMTYYQTLGLPATASTDDIKRAHRDLAKQFHPDRLRGAPAWEVKRASQKFQEIQEAYEALIRHRLEYDKQLRDEAAAASPPAEAQPGMNAAPVPGPSDLGLAPPTPAPVEPSERNWSRPAIPINFAPRQAWYLFGLGLTIIVRLMIFYAVREPLTQLDQERAEVRAAEIRVPPADQFEGTMSNAAGSSSAVFDIAFHDTYSKLAGCMAVQPPFSGSGTLSGRAYGPYFRFTVKSQAEEYSFSGKKEGDDITGKYSVDHKNGPAESGTFSLVKLSSQSDSNTLAVENCPADTSTDAK